MSFFGSAYYRRRAFRVSNPILHACIWMCGLLVKRAGFAPRYWLVSAGWLLVSQSPAETNRYNTATHTINITLDRVTQV